MIRSRYAKRRGSRKSKTSYRTRRSYKGRTRSSVTKRRTRRTPRTSNKMILNLTSKKKRDTMAPNTAYPASTSAISGLQIQGSDQATMTIWSPTARMLREVFENDKSSVPSGREETTCYVVGVKERISLLTNTGKPWKWRRVVFTHKGPLPLGEQFEGPRVYSTITDVVGRDTYYRTLSPLPALSKTQIVEYLFKGQGNDNSGIADWTDITTAPMDTTRIKVLHDKVTHIQSGNESGVMRTTTRWHNVRKNIVYGDEEIGGQVLSSAMSTNSRPGIGDIYIFDIFTSLSNDASDSMAFVPTATVYWHER
ncbi:capsid protein [Plant associated genomovirus 18]|nr:capsid protein [Plant associated genomovirus 18]QCX29504.1 capsid protein [Plant associated genomovirus 18]